MNVLELGTRDYREVWSEQIRLVEARQRGEIDDTLIVVEHPHIFTLGRRRESKQNVLAPGDVEVIEIERGGDVTYHGPGQLVAYPILLLADGERDLHAYLRNLEEAAIRTCAEFGIDAGRELGKTGAWSNGKKLCSIGIACRKWVTFHGLALNVSTDLSYFARINPCGFDANVMTAMDKLAPSATVATVKPVLIAQLASTLRRSYA